MNCILVSCSNQIQEFFPLQEGVVRVGRESDNDIQLLDESVSRHHAQLSNLPNVCDLQDQNSSNGTFVNGKRIQSAILRHGDEIRFGNSMMRFETVNHEVHDDIGKARDYSAMSQHSTVRVKRHPSQMEAPTPQKETATFTPPQITIKRKSDT